MKNSKDNQSGIWVQKYFFRKKACVYSESNPSSISRIRKKTELLFLLLGIILSLNSCDNEETLPVTNEPDPTGTIVVKIVTVGRDDNPEGYTLNVQGSAARQVDPNGEVTISDKKVGRYTIELTNISNHCTGNGNMLIEVNVTADGTTTVEFEVECKAILRDRIVYSKGSNNFTDFKYYSSKLDGSDEKLILDKITPFSELRISPDGTKLAFTDGIEGTTLPQVFVMDADGENLEMIPFEPSDNPAMTAQFNPVWHPDGKKLTFRNGPRTVTYNMETGERSVIEFGSSEFLLVTDVFDNGNKFLGIYFDPQSPTSTIHRLAVVNSDGSDLRFLKEVPNLIFSSPRILNGNNIAYTQRVNTPGMLNEVWKINIDGSEDEKISDKMGFLESERLHSFAFSPDGSEFIFYASNALDFFFAKTKINGTLQRINFSSGGIRRNPDWSRVTRR